MDDAPATLDAGYACIGRGTMTRVRAVPWWTVPFFREYRVREKPSRFDATMVLSTGEVRDYLGTHQHLAVDLDLTVEADELLHLRSGAQRFYEGCFVAFRVPILFSCRADLRESWHDAA